MKLSSKYNHSFWNVMKGKTSNFHDIQEGYESGSYVIPCESKQKLDAAIAKENLFRRLGTIVNLSVSDGVIQAISSTGEAKIVGDGEAFPESLDTFTEFPVKSFKLASMSRLNKSFVVDMNFDLEKYLLSDFAKRFGRAEENVFINGNGVTEPTGILTKDANVITEASDTISFDEVIMLYFSLKAEYRKTAVFLMHDDTAMFLRTLKDASGNYLWNTNNDTIFGKPVITSPYMPTLGEGGKTIVFGDLSYYWIIERQPLSIKRFNELYALQNQIDFSGHERIDGKLIEPKAVSILQVRA
jgi:HK97 family phage major capsid protein